MPGALRKVDTLFEVIGLQIMGISSVRNESDEWLLESCCTCKRRAPCQACLVRKKKSKKTRSPKIDNTDIRQTPLKHC